MRFAMAVLLATVTVVRAEKSQVDFDLITLPTDLIAAVSGVEDDIAISDLLQTSPPQSPDNQSNTVTAPTNSQTLSGAQGVTDLTTASNDASESDSQTSSGAKAAALQPAQTVAGGTAEISVEQPVAASSEAKLDVAAISKPASNARAESTIEALSDQVGRAESDLPNTQKADPDGAAKQVAAIAPSPDPQTSGDAVVSSGTSAKTVNQLVAPQQDALVNEDELILAWATAWSDNDVEAYLSFYSEDFVPDDTSLDRASWEQVRRERLKNKNIRIIVSNAEVYRADDQIIEIRFTQRYTSKSYRDRVIKSIEMTKTSNGWKFLSERTIESLPFE